METDAGSTFIDCIAENNSVGGLTSTPFYELGGTFNRKKDNYGYNPVGVISTPFGGPIASPFNNTNSTIGGNGSSANPTSGQIYTANEPVDVTIGAGTVQSITTKDNFGNVIDNGVGTLIHRLLLPGYTITVTFAAVGSVTLVQATIGPRGTSAIQQANVHYVVDGVGMYLTGGSVTAGIITDGTSNTGGNTVDVAMTNFMHYFVPVGWIYSAATVAISPTVSGT